MEEPVLLDKEQLQQAISHLPKDGLLAQSPTGLVYLKIDDAYIHRVFPLLKEPGIIKPDYFQGERAIGAHISLVYPEEDNNLHNWQAEIGEQYSFTAGSVFSMRINNKHYYALKVVCPPLIKLRTRYGLPQKLCFKRHWVDLHITIGVRLSDSNN
jgi:hypothetical protein